MVHREHRVVAAAATADILDAPPVRRDAGVAIRSRLGAIRPLRLFWPLLWIALALLLLFPTLCFLVLAISPRLFAQGTEWLTIGTFAEALRGQAVRGMVNSL